MVKKREALMTRGASRGVRGVAAFSVFALTMLGATSAFAVEGAQSGDSSDEGLSVLGDESLVDGGGKVAPDLPLIAGLVDQALGQSSDAVVVSGEATGEVYDAPGHFDRESFTDAETAPRPCPGGR